MAIHALRIEVGDDIFFKILKEYFLDKEIPIFDNKTDIQVAIECKDLERRLDLNKLIACNKQSCNEIIRRYAKEKNLSDEETEAIFF